MRPTHIPLIIAHRGYSSHYPENTLVAFQKAIEAQCDIIELDIHLSRDEEIVVAHDYKLGRTSNKRGFINDFTLFELQKMDAGSWFSKEFSNQTIPSLREVLTLVNKQVVLNIEIKHETLIDPRHHLVMAQKLLSILVEFGCCDYVIVSSFDYEMLRLLRTLDSTLKLGILDHYLKKGINLDLINEIDAYSYHPRFSKLNVVNVAQLKEKGIKIFPYTANRINEFKKLTYLKVDGIITNEIEKLRLFLGQ